MFPEASEIRHNAPKRLFDILFSSCLLLGGSWLFLLIACAVRLSSPGPVLYACTRIGRGGREFRCWKFRTMCVDAEAKLRQLLEDHPMLREEWNTYRKLKCDPRITTVGRFLRKTSLDELPQFWNVLKGDLSIVGPRPPTFEEVGTFFGAKSRKILSIRPGITGLWQTSGRNLLTYEGRVELDETYVDQRTFLMDLKLIAKTILRMLVPKGSC